VKRLLEIDFLRGIAILMMVVFHFTWSLNHFGVIHLNLLSGGWNWFQNITGGLFIFLVGVSLTLSYSKVIKKSPHRYPLKYLARGIRVFGYGMIITLVSYIIFPDAYVFFGILHFIGASIILVTPFINFTWLNLFLGIFTLAFGAWASNIIVNVPWLVWFGFWYPINTIDIYTIVPWIGLVFLGLFAGNMIYHRKKKVKFGFVKEKKFVELSKPVRFLGRWSLFLQL